MGYSLFNQINLQSNPVFMNVVTLESVLQAAIKSATSIQNIPYYGDTLDELSEDSGRTTLAKVRPQIDSSFSEFTYWCVLAFVGESPDTVKAKQVSAATQIATAFHPRKSGSLGCLAGAKASLKGEVEISDIEGFAQDDRYSTLSSCKGAVWFEIAVMVAI